MSITIADVAKRAGVSKSTVSRVLNDKADVGRATADRVRSAPRSITSSPCVKAACQS